MALVACPFCREMFEEAEAKECPVCGMSLVAFEKLPPSVEAEQDGIAVEPHHELLPWTYLGRNRGILALIGLVGMVVFMLPWVHVVLPDNYTFSGFDLSRKLGWSWAAGVAWLVLVPTVLSRRTITQLRGARVAAAFLVAHPTRPELAANEAAVRSVCAALAVERYRLANGRTPGGIGELVPAFLSAVPFVTTSILYLRPPHRGLVPLHFVYDPAFWITMALSLAAFVLSIRLGGRLDDIKVRKGTSAGQVLN